jgi:mono/diheme cytochrome c family protein
LINRQEALIADAESAPEKVSVVGDFPDDIKDLFQAPGTCTDETAALIGTTCDDAGPDSDRDGVSDPTEKALTAIAEVSMETITILVPTSNPGEPITYSFEPNPLYDVRFDPFDDFTNETAEGPVADLEVADELLAHLEEDVLLLTVTSERLDAFLADLMPGLAFLEEALEEQPWAVDFDQVASDMGVSTEDAQLAVGLFNAYCARCHTGGYSAGAAFEQGAGSGAWGPALNDGRSVTQFPNADDQKVFIVTGSQNAVGYGVNGIGRGWMPGFGNVLSEEQIDLIVQYERTM